MLDKEIIRLKVTGDFACFTRPDLKVERMSYPCMTPSAARGVLEAILWKKEFQWVIKKIIVLRPIKFASIKRNEITKKQSFKSGPIDILKINNQGKPENRVQRNSIVLKDVGYIIEASIYVDEDIIRRTKDSEHPITVPAVCWGADWARAYRSTSSFPSRKMTSSSPSPWRNWVSSAAFSSSVCL